jgi:predicted esterase
LELKKHTTHIDIGRFAPVLFILLLASLSAHAADNIAKEKFESEGKQRTYYLFVPASVKEAKAVPLIVLLHGSGRDGLSLVEKWKDLADTEGFIIVGPDASDRGGWRMPQDAPEFLYELVEMLIKKYPIAPDRIYLFGHSAGAVIALDLAMLESEYFAAVAVHAGAWRTDKEFSFIDGATRKTPIMIAVGDRDTFFPLESVKRTQKALIERGFTPKVILINNHTHWYYDIASEINRDAWQFLKAHALTQERKHTPRAFKSGAKEFNSITKQINQLRIRANDLLGKFYAAEGQLQGKDFVKNKAVVLEVARNQVQILSEAVTTLREAAATADKASQMKIPTTFQKYFSMLVQASNLRAESCELLRQRAELLLSGEATSEVMTKRAQLGDKSDALNASAEELERQAEQLIQG